MTTYNKPLGAGSSTIGWAAAVLIALTSGCSVNVWPGGGGNGGPDTMLRVTGGGGDGDTVTIWFVNETDNDAVDVGFYVTNEVLDALPDDLFVEENHVTASIGVAGLGIIEPGTSDSIDFECSADLVIGTDGGTFLDNETGEEQGVGTRRWAQEGPLALCGSVVTFTFSRD